MTDSRRYGQISNQVFEEAETKPLEEKKTLLVNKEPVDAISWVMHYSQVRYLGA
jgi:hypothetical protein